MQTNNLADIRNEYTKQTLDIDQVSRDPISQFNKWFEEAQSAQITEPTAMTLCTVSKECKPSSRIVLLKGVVNNTFVFFTNYESQKGKELQQNPYASLCFFWPELERQIRIDGLVEKTDKSASDDYFQTRPKGSQIGAWASPQSSIIENRTVLEEKVEALSNQYDNKEVPRPNHWGGYQLYPELVEFWQGRASRLHDRIQYKKSSDNQWLINRLAP
ncbi:pyridoxamine 5'-phosphate oxidase [Fulvivirgaceae bacterium BMA10]|uniref:Pyridoxine/pyridoxamine 5'-phosphate oxidase n=1 Tax=Splendidivirga corallicola TaxID=3051826 RepID=A0ABT8KVW4_9BACT|nr:pyridoxamine 5'-phosphate oxidase [Fulvivirgaceae bacterium BMA10]